MTSISRISDILPLKFLNLSNNQIKNLDGIHALKNLTSLDLHANQLTDISALAGCINLENLNLEQNLLTNSSKIVKILERLEKLQKLSVLLNPIMSVENCNILIKTLKLKVLNRVELCLNSKNIMKSDSRIISAQSEGDLKHNHQMLELKTLDIENQALRQEIKNLNDLITSLRK